MMALQPNQKIKDPHPPADWKTVTDISAKHCVHGWRKAEHIARREENFDEFLRVPGVHETKINIHRAVHRPLVAREQSLRSPGRSRTSLRASAHCSPLNTARKTPLLKIGSIKPAASPV